MRLNGKVAIVTGSGLGLGREMAEMFASEGAAVVVNGRRADPVDLTVERIRERGGRAVGVVADVTDSGGAGLLVAGAVKAFGRLDVLVNNAGAMVTRTDAAMCTEEEWRSTIDVNLTSVFLCSKVAFPELARHRGSIVNIASVFGLTGAPHRAAYVASKAGVIGLTRSTAIDFGKAGVRANAVCPAYIETDMNRQLLAEYRRTGVIDEILNQIPLGCLGVPEDVAHAAVYLAADEARWVTGAVLAVDGGLTAGRT